MFLTQLSKKSIGHILKETGELFERNVKICDPGMIVEID